MASITVPYMSPMVLGTTYDYSRSKVGSEIFPEAAVNDPVETSHHITHIKYSVIKDSKDIRDVLDVSGQLSLQVMAGLVNVEGEGSYLKSSTESKNFVEVLAKISYQTVTKSIKSDKEPNKDWAKKTNLIGKHYVRSITYGGYLIASLKFEVEKEEDKEKITAKVDVNVNTAKLAVGVKGQFEHLVSSVKDKSGLTIKYTSSGRPDKTATDLDSLVKAITDFPKLMKTVNKGVGVAIEAELVELSQLDKSDNLKFLIDGATLARVNTLEWMYRDLKKTLGALEIFITENEIENANVETKMNNLYTNVEKILRAFNLAIAAIDLNAVDSANGKSVNPFKDAFEAYRKNKTLLPNRFYRRYQVLALMAKGIRKENRGTKDENQLLLLEKRLKPSQCYLQDANQLPNSLILKKLQKDVSSLLTQLLPVPGPWVLCYRLSSMGPFKAADFHARCDNKGPTVTIVRTTDSLGKNVFGGYADKSWGGPDGAISSDESFIFSLFNKKNLKFKAPVYRNNDQALYTKSNYGPAFGINGNDFHLTEHNSNVAGVTKDFGETYQLPSGVIRKTKKAKKLLAGTAKEFFSLSEVEVFYLR